ncbi:MAG: GHKL domain-containing protein [Spirochaetaceae bacterium]|nr:GHKL domain-containing protein [Spirochaetaceae bacterium]MCF7947156.1 GHKL domain-containing protein [Spirochaetia bacterium]MCF7950021.1 GHKL domain-containing protein [Spirochaetaceae bacterium]
MINSAAYFSEWLKWLPIPVFIVNPESVVIHCNQNAAIFLGLDSAEQLQGKQLVNFYRYPEDWRVLVERLYKETEVREFEVMYKTIDGNQAVAIESSHITDKNKITIIGRDISQRVRLEGEIMSTNMELMDLNAKLHAMHSQLAQEKNMASLGTLAAGLAHEMNNPLSFLKGNLKTCIEYFEELEKYIKSLEGLLQKKAGDMSAHAETIGKLKEQYGIEEIYSDVKELWRETESGISRMSEIIRSLSIFTTPKTEKHGEILVDEALHTALVLTRAAERDSLRLKTNIHSLPPVKGPMKELVQAFNNLLFNAIEAAEKSESGVVRIHTRSDETWVYCDIINNGPAIPKEHQNRVFDPFFTTKEVGQGTGLGLTAVHQVIINSFGGYIFLHSDQESTCFTVRLPRAS